MVPEVSHLRKNVTKSLLEVGNDSLKDPLILVPTCQASDLGN